MAPLLIGAVVGCLIFYFIRRYNKFTPSMLVATIAATVISTCGISQGLPWASFSTESMFCWWLSFSTVARFVTKENLTACLRRKRGRIDEADYLFSIFDSVLDTFARQNQINLLLHSTYSYLCIQNK